MRTQPLQPHEIRSLRRALGLTQAKFGEFFQKDASTIYRWENGYLDPDPANMAALIQLWNDVQEHYGWPPPRRSDDVKNWAKGLLAGGVIMYLLMSSGEGGDDRDD